MPEWAAVGGKSGQDVGQTCGHLSGGRLFGDVWTLQPPVRARRGPKPGCSNAAPETEFGHVGNCA
jgi:hypothetical protein